MMRALTSITLIASVSLAGAHGTLADTTYGAVFLRTFTGPMSYRDSASGVTFYVESDGRHVAALNRGGKLLWVKCPHDEAHVPAYRTSNPQIVWVGPAQTRGLPAGRSFVGISYNNSQFGALDIATGDFVFEGQD